MSQIISGSLEQIASHLTRSMAGFFEAELDRQLHAHLDPLIREAAKNIAKRAAGTVSEWRGPLDGDKLRISLSIDKMGVPL